MSTYPQGYLSRFLFEFSLGQGNGLFFFLQLSFVSFRFSLFGRYPILNGSFFVGPLRLPNDNLSTIGFFVRLDFGLAFFRVGFFIDNTINY
jgi:hypothetical protein